MEALIATVQHNCDIVDARHGGEYGMCTYLLKMRERYRWEQGLPLGARLSRDAVGQWLTRREDHLETLEQAEFRPIECGGWLLDPFDAESINQCIAAAGLVYSGGLAGRGRPHFFLAELEQEQRAEDGFVLRVSGRELARCLNAPPAMTAGSTIFLRRESLRRFLWEKYESWLWNRPENAMAEAVACYPFDRSVGEALDQMVDAEMAVVAAHERGEFEAGRALGEAWNAMLLDVSTTPAELMARAVRDHIADCSHTLPMLLRRRQTPSLHLFFANLDAMRKDIFPALLPAYCAWRSDRDTRHLAGVIRHGAAHWMGIAREIIALHQWHGPAAAGAIAQAVTAARL